MKAIDYIGSTLQYSGVRKFALLEGKAKGMEFYRVRNGLGLELVISLDRCFDISELNFKGINCSYLAPCDYVSSQYFNNQGNEFLKSFSAGFLTTCGLRNVGNPCDDAGESLGLHGTISNTPSTNNYYVENSEEIILHGTIIDGNIFDSKLVLEREIRVSKKNNTFKIKDTIENAGDKVEPLCLLYHMNLGYPLLSENSEIEISSSKVRGRDTLAESEIDKWKDILPPQSQYKERCYYHCFNSEKYAKIANKCLNMELKIKFDDEKLDKFVQWKMFGKRDYVLGFEPGNSLPDGRNIIREQGELKYIKPNERQTFVIDVELNTIKGD